MGVDTEFVAMIGIKSDYNFVTDYPSKNLSYIEDLNNGELERFKNVVFADRLPEGYTVYSDGMCLEYSAIGKLLAHPTEYLDEIRNIDISFQDFETMQLEVYKELRDLGLDVLLTDIKLHIFIHFS